MTESLSLAEVIDRSQRIVFFTGAGVSTESGIPDFRSPGGIWSKFQPIEFQDFVSSEDMRREAWRRKKEIDKDMRAAQPNRGHHAIARLIEIGKCTCVITQNIDGLHQASGIADDKIIELHGNSTYAKCLSCERRHELEPFFAAIEHDQALPVCADCGGIVKTATISFGQAMPPAAMAEAEQHARAADLFIVVGSSLVVYPAAGFPLLAKRAGAKLVIINRESTEQDASADLVLHAEIGETLGAAVDIVMGRSKGLN